MHVKITKAWLTAMILLLGLLAISCHNSKKDTLKTSLQTLNATRDGFLVWDRQHKDAIVDSADTYEDGEVRLNMYREKRAAIILGFELAYKAVAIAAVDRTDRNIKEMLANLEMLYRSILEFKNALTR